MGVVRILVLLLLAVAASALRLSKWGRTAVGAYPSVAESRDRLHRAGWSVGEMAFGPGQALVWVVGGTNGENRIEGRGRSQAEAWYRATQQAAAVGMLARPREVDGTRG